MSYLGRTVSLDERAGEEGRLEYVLAWRCRQDERFVLTADERSTRSSVGILGCQPLTSQVLVIRLSVRLMCVVGKDAGHVVWMCRSRSAPIVLGGVFLGFLAVIATRGRHFQSQLTKPS